MVHLLRRMSEHRHLLMSASTISLITILSRIFGYIRDSRIAFLLGTGDAADAFTIAYRIPNLLRRLAAEGAVNAAVIPVFSAYLSENRKEEAWEFINTLTTLALVVLTSVTILGVIFSPFLTGFLATGFQDSPGKLEMTSVLNRIMFPYITFITLSALAMGVLNSFHQFVAPALGPVVMNLGVIGFSVMSGFFSDPAMALAIGVLAGGALQLGIQIPALVRNGWRLRLAWNLANPGIQRFGRLMLPLLFGFGIVQINIFVALQFASHMAEGSVASLYIADRIMELVLGGYTIALSTAILPLLARQATDKRIDDLKKTLNLATRLVLFITVPATVGLMILRREIIQVLFERGTFAAASTELTSRPLFYFALGLMTISMVKIMVPAFYALHDTRTPVAVAFLSMLLNIGLNFLFMGPLQNGGPALATTLAATFDAGCLLLVFGRKYGSFDLRDVGRSLSKFVVASGVMASVTFFLIQLPGFYAGNPAQRVLALTLTIAVAAGTYFGSSYLLRTRELDEVWGMYGLRREKQPQLLD